MTSDRIVRTRPRKRNLTYGTFWLDGDYNDWTAGAACVGGKITEHNREGMIRMLLNPPRKRKGTTFHWVALNAGKSDFAYLEKDLVAYAAETGTGIPLTASGNAICMIRVDTPAGMIQFRDLTAKLKPPEDTDALSWAAHAFCPGWEPVSDEPKIRAESLWHVFTELLELHWSLFGVNMKITSGSDGVTAWMATLPEGYVYYRQHKEKETFFRTGRSGGLNMPGYDNKIHRDMVTVDRTAAYAACMLEGGYPTDNGVETNMYHPGKRGIYECKVSAPRFGSILFVPIRNGGEWYWTGEGTCVISDETYEEAVKSGYQLEVIRGYFFRRLEDVFTPFLRRCEQLESGGDPAIKALIKPMRNGLNGKFAMRETIERPYWGLRPEGEDVRMRVDYLTGERLPGYEKTEECDASSVNPHWYLITVQRQILWMKRVAEQIPEDRRGHCITDCFTTTTAVYEDLLAAGIVTEGSRYGDVKVHRRWDDYQSAGVYRYCGHVQDGSFTACKTIPAFEVSQAAKGIVLSFPPAENHLVHWYLTDDGRWNPVLCVTCAIDNSPGKTRCTTVSVSRPTRT